MYLLGCSGPSRAGDAAEQAQECLPSPVGEIIGERTLQLLHHLLRRGLGPSFSTLFLPVLLPFLPAGLNLGQLLFPPQLLHRLQGA